MAEKRTQQFNNKDLPDKKVIETVLEEENYKSDYLNAIRTTVYTIVTIAAMALLIATLLLPVIQIYSDSMEPTIAEDSIVLAVKSGLPDRGDVLAFYYNNKILVRRVIGLPGDEIIIDDHGTVFVNGKSIDESYISNKGYGTVDIGFPYEVPPGQYFVMADNRNDNTDSRVSLFGCITEEDFIGNVKFCIWPLSSFGFVD